MSLVQFKLDRSVDQTRGIFDKFVYKPDNGDTVADATASGYFALSRFKSQDNWVGSVIDAQMDDAFVILKVLANDDVQVIYNDMATTNAMPKAPTGQLSVGVDNQWVNSAEVSGVPIYSFSEIGISGPGQIMVDNADLSLVTEITVSKEGLNGSDLSTLFEKFYTLDVVALSDYLDNTNFLIANVTGEAVDSGVTYKVPVSVSSSNGSLTSGELTRFVIQSTATRSPNISIERLYDGESALLTQEPSALDTPEYIQFGPVQGTAQDPVQALAQGGDAEASILRINQAGTYRLKTAIQYGRETNPGIAILNFRALVNGVQAGRSINQRLNNSNVTALFTDEAWLTLPAGVDITYEVIRDSGGANSGGLIAGETSGSTGWNAAPTAALRVERWR